MKTEYLIHEYMWSNHCISGNKLGWGITASSMPEDRAYLRELEKLAQAAVIDKTGKTEVDELVYSSVCGFVKMSSVPCESGEDKRQNKRVRIYQPKAPESNPVAYLAPGGEWAEEESVGYLQPLFLEEPEFNRKDILQEMNLMSRLPEFMQVVFWCLSGHSEGINIVAPDWKEEEFAEKAKRLMYVIHSLLPQPARERAGYVSFTREAIPSVSFYFSQKVCGTKYFNLSEKSERNDWENTQTALDQYFYNGFAQASQKEDEIYRDFQKTAGKYLKNVRDNGNLLKKVEWIFYDIARKHGQSALSIEILSENFPELLYWVCKDKALEYVAEDILKEIREYKFSAKERQKYIENLLTGMTGRSRERILKEIDRVLGEVFEEDKVEFASLLAIIREKNKDIYTSLLCETLANQKLSDYGKSLFRMNARDMESLYKYVKDFNEEKVPGEQKDEILRTGIGLLNEELFDKDRFELFDKIAIHLNRREQWIKILQDFVKQLQEHASLFNKKQLDTACYVEEMLGGYRPETRMVLRQERGHRTHRIKKGGQSKDSSEEDSDMGRRYKKSAETEEEKERKTGTEIENVEAAEASLEEEGPAVPFLLMGFPQGFLTGCIMYLSHYSLMIGHWKIALGMAGMWVLLMLNYQAVIIQRKASYPLWKVVGLCLVEGWIIEAAAWFFRSQKVRLYYFIILGVITVCIQVVNLLRLKKEKSQMEEESAHAGR